MLTKFYKAILLMSLIAVIHGCKNVVQADSIVDTYAYLYL